MLRFQPTQQAQVPEKCEIGIFSAESTLCVKACVMGPEYLVAKTL